MMQTNNAANAGALDKDLMSVGAFSLDQLMELVGLSVSQADQTRLLGHIIEQKPDLNAVYRVHSPAKERTY